jgi:hypothetical protein
VMAIPIKPVCAFATNLLSQAALAFPTWAWAVSSLGILIAFGLAPFGVRTNSLIAKK